MFNIMDMIGGYSLERNQNKVYGVTVGIVTDNNDPDGLYRVKLRYPSLDNGAPGGETGFWARIATFGAGKDRGMFILPEVDDEVLVAFERGEMSQPFVIGSLWNSTSTTHLKNKDQDGKNHKRMFKSRSGHYLEFDDNDKDQVEAISLQTKAGAKLRLDDKNGAHKVELRDSKNENYLLLDEENKKTTLENTSGDMDILAKNKITIKCTELYVETSANAKFKVGANFEVNASSNVKINASGTGDVTSSGTMTIKGSTVNIN